MHIVVILQLQLLDLLIFIATISDQVFSNCSTHNATIVASLPGFVDSIMFFILVSIPSIEDTEYCAYRRGKEAE